MAKKKKEISLDELEKELGETEKVKEEDKEKEEEEPEKIEEIEEFAVEEAPEEEKVEEEKEAEEAEEAPKEEIIDERIYIVPLAKARRGPRTKWAKKAIRFMREYITRHFKPESLKLSQKLNEAIWSRGVKKPPRKIKVRATKNIDGLVVVYPAEE